MRTNIRDVTPLTPGTCEWCGKICELEDTTCSMSCEAQLIRLEATQGRLVIRAMKLWRMHRGRKGSPAEGTIMELSGLIDSFLRDDKSRRERAGQQRRQKEGA